MTHIWTRRPKIIEPNREIVVAGPKMRGFFKFEAVRPDGRRRLLADWFPNLITDAGLNRVGTSGNWRAYVRVGTGSTTPAVTDTQLASHLAETATVQSFNTAAQVSVSPYYCAGTTVYRFGAGAAAGNLAEVGIADQAVASSTDVLWSRALILDSSGDPTTITILSDEFLDVTYQLRTYCPMVDATYDVVISSVTYSVTQRTSEISNPSYWGNASSNGFLGGWTTVNVLDGAMGAITGSPSGSSGSAGPVNASYGNNNLYTDATATFGLSAGNFGGGIRSMVATGGQGSGGGGRFQWEFTPHIPKISTQILALTLRHSWGRGQS